jgi:hypothetical protein
MEFGPGYNLRKPASKGLSADSKIAEQGVVNHPAQRKLRVTLR